MPKVVPISIEISNEMYKLYYIDGLPTSQISQWLLETHQIKYSPMSVYRRIKKMINPKLTEPSSTLDLENIDSIELLRRVQRKTYQVSDELLKQNNITGWRDSLRLCIEATALLRCKFDDYGIDDADEEEHGVKIPRFVVNPKDPHEPN